MSETAAQQGFQCRPDLVIVIDQDLSHGLDNVDLYILVDGVVDEPSVQLSADEQGDILAFEDHIDQVGIFLVPQIGDHLIIEPV